MIDEKRQDNLAPLCVGIPKAAALVGVSRAMLYAEIAAGRGPKVFKVGARSLIALDDLRAWIDVRREQMA